MAINPYQRSWEKYDSEHYLPISVSYGKPIYVTKDGKIKARGFVDINDDLELYIEDDHIKSRFIVDEAMTKVFDINHTDQFEYKLNMYEKLTQCFQTYLNPVHIYNNTNPPAHFSRYKLLSKKTKAEISSKLSSSLQTPKSFQWVFSKGGHLHVDLPKVESSWLGPYNFDTYISPENILQDVSDLMVIKSGVYWKTDPPETDFNLKSVAFSTGINAHIYATTPSLPEHPFGPFSEAAGGISNTPDKFFKIPRSGNSNLTPESSPSGIGVGPIGLFKNGVFLHSYLDGDSFNDSGVWHTNTIVTNAGAGDPCNGFVHDDPDISNIGVYHYKTSPPCLYGFDDITAHSPLLGYAVDGYPIYGGVGYSVANDASSSAKRIETSYRLKPLASRPGVDAPEYEFYPSGFFVEDYEYVLGLGDLDAHNGRDCVTPEYPLGTYAYFTTVGLDWEPVYPYVIGPTFYGKVSSQNGLGGAITEPIAQRPPYQTEEWNAANQPADIGSWRVYSDDHYINDGLRAEYIIWVSPHVLKEGQGVFLTTGYEQYLQSTGVWDYNLHTGSGMATFSGNRRMATGDGDFFTFESPFFYPTSKECNFIAGHPFSGGMQFLYTDPDTNTMQTVTSAPRTLDTEFYEIYSGHKYTTQRVFPPAWNGKIPAGVPFKIETWAFNGFEVGFEGRVKIWPCEPHPLTSGNTIVISSQTIGKGESKGAAYQDAVFKAKKSLAKDLNTLHVASGIKNERASMRAYRKLRRRNAPAGETQAQQDGF